MARRPVRDECSDERVWVKELAAFLSAQPADVLKVARKYGRVRKAPGGCGRIGPKWVTERQALFVITEIRAYQGAFALDGVDWWERARKNREATRRRQERARAREAEKAAAEAQIRALLPERPNT